MRTAEYHRGVQAAFEALQSGETPFACLKAVGGNRDAFDQGWSDQCNAWPEVLPMPETRFEQTDGNILMGIFSGIALTTGLFAIVGFPKLSGPAAGALFIITVIAGIAAYRNRKP